MGTTLPSVHIQSAYGQAMLYTRFYDSARRDHRRALAWINTAIALSSLRTAPEIEPDPDFRHNRELLASVR
ncbi:MAG: hypothetical protein ACRDPY_29740 [Streptosporangiaceae bacterium]